MTPEQQRIAIAEACGWKPHPAENVGAAARLFNGDVWFRHAESHTIATPEQLPDYFDDLNAMHEAEKVLPIDRQYEYGEKLRVISGNVGPKGGHFTPNGFGCYALAHLSATQRAEAFLRTLNLWKD